MKDYRTHLEVQSTATTFDGSMTVELLRRRFTPGGFSFFFCQPLGNFSDPIDGILFGRESLDLFRRFTRPTNIHYPANPGLPSLTLKMGSLSDIPQNMRPGDASLQADIPCSAHPNRGLFLARRVVRSNRRRRGGAANLRPKKLAPTYGAFLCSWPTFARGLGKSNVGALSHQS